MSERKEVRVPIRIWTLMQNQGIKSLEGFERYGRFDVLRFPNIGLGTLKQLEALMAAHGLSLKPEEPARALTVPVYEKDAAPQEPAP